jgi:CheY-like chemotaxis protein/HD-like signal output (HDOD) protein
MRLILVVDDMAVFREPIAASLRLAGYETLCAADGVEALELTLKHQPELILLDVSMPRMDGLTFLKRLRSEPTIAKTRVMLLTALSEKDHVLTAATLGVRDYLLKSRFRLTDLLDRIKKADPAASGAPETPVTVPTAATAATAAPAPLPVKQAAAPGSPANAPPATVKSIDTTALLTRDQFIQRIEQVFEAKTLSGVIAQVIAMASSPRGDAAQLATLIGRDTMLSARILQTANSANYASHGAPVTTIPDALRKVGFSTVRNTAAALGVFDCIPDAGADGFNPIHCWQHSFAVAQLCEKLVSVHSPDQAGLAYLIGLCHDLGDIFIRTQFGKEYQQVIEAARETGRPVEQLHVEMLGVSHQQMISAVLKCMAIPDAIREPIETFHAANGSSVTGALARALWLAEHYANAAMLASSPGSEVAPATQAFCRSAVGDLNPAGPDPATLRSEVQSMTVSLARLSRTDEAKLLVPMFKAGKAKIWVARHKSISSFDPIATTLGTMASVSVYDRLPSAREMRDIGGVVVVAGSANAAGFTDGDIQNLLAKAQAEGHAPAVLAFSCEEVPVNRLAKGFSWRTSAALAELWSFVEALAQPSAKDDVGGTEEDDEDTSTAGRAVTNAKNLKSAYGKSEVGAR